MESFFKSLMNDPQVLTSAVLTVMEKLKIRVDENDMTLQEAQQIFEEACCWILIFLPTLPDLEIYSYANEEQSNVIDNFDSEFEQDDESHRMRSAFIELCFSDFNHLFLLLRKPGVIDAAYIFLLYYIDQHSLLGKNYLRVKDFTSLVEEMLVSPSCMDVQNGLTMLYAVLSKSTMSYESPLRSKVTINCRLRALKTLQSDRIECHFTRFISQHASMIHKDFMKDCIPNGFKLSYDWLQELKNMADIDPSLEFFTSPLENDIVLLNTGFTDVLLQFFSDGYSPYIDPKRAKVFLENCGNYRHTKNCHDIRNVFNNIIKSLMSCFDQLFKVVLKWYDTPVRESMSADLTSCMLEEIDIKFGCPCFIPCQTRSEERISSPLLESRKRFADRAFFQEFLKVTKLLAIFRALNRHCLKILQVDGIGQIVSFNALSSQLLDSLAWTLVVDLEKSGKCSTELPWWMESLIVYCPYLMSTHRRLEIFQTSMKLKKKMPVLKVSLQRKRVLCQLDHYSTENSIYRKLWHVEYVNEIGKGQGVFRELLSKYSEEIQEYYLDIWIGEPTKKDDGLEYVFHPNGLFPSPSSTGSHLFYVLGIITANALLMGCRLDVRFNALFIKNMLRGGNFHDIPITIDDLKSICPSHSNFIDGLIRVVKEVEKIQRGVEYQSCSEAEKTLALKGITCDGTSFEDLCINFTLPGYSDIEMIPGGRETYLTQYNAKEYLKLMAYWYVYRGPRKKLEKFRNGFEQLLPMSSIGYLRHDELHIRICSSGKINWTLEDLEKYCKFRNGYDKDSAVIQNFFFLMMNMSEKGRYRFLKFVTALTSLPPGGLKGLSPPLTICRVVYDDPDSYLPTSSTCFNLLYLPEYTRKNILCRKILYAIKECSSFHII